MNLTNAEIGKEYIIQSIDTQDDELNSFLFTLGCYSGQAITVLANKKNGIVISIKDSRYNIDLNLANLISII
ncbi:MAG: FeoA family protein [Floccifex porci]|uniref:Ferrous iron transport protein A n=1 Tax=Floccifex porci TaxID=2606629 RepID=A0A7X2T411_9FIRM|nr:FeoA family protein [Floccifex porci]MCI7802860.1 ferrous iron transport protein A [Erysipelotrichaceae bacterium]MDD7467461.1 FeoA family protein [Floccifex porci]MDY4796325.1 FeoA family protein [Floccifex porci]MSS01281.1 ferrous iron transport protein A [Floccifex porci]